MPEFIVATTEEDYNAAALLFREYAAWLNIDLGFQNFEKEMKSLNSMYALPAGGIILCKEGTSFIGCVGVRKMDESTAEMKRMWVRPGLQSKGIGTQLLIKAVALAKACGYQKIRLDTLSTMTPAMNLYRKNGFIETPPYYYNPNEEVVYFEKDL